MLANNLFEERAGQGGLIQRAAHSSAVNTILAFNLDIVAVCHS